MEKDLLVYQNIINKFYKSIVRPSIKSEIGLDFDLVFLAPKQSDSQNKWSIKNLGEKLPRFIRNPKVDTFDDRYIRTNYFILQIWNKILQNVGLSYVNNILDLDPYFLKSNFLYTDEQVKDDLIRWEQETGITDGSDPRPPKTFIVSDYKDYVISEKTGIIYAVAFNGNLIPDWTSHIAGLPSDDFIYSNFDGESLEKIIQTFG